MATETSLQAFLFTDIVGSTDLKRRLGDAEGAQVIAAHDASFRESVARFGGVEQDNPGDGFFATFPVPSAALNCALAFQAALAEQRVQARVGIHMGEAVHVPGTGDRHKLLGLAVDTGGRVMSLAMPNQVLITRHAFDSARQQVLRGPADERVVWRAHGAYVFKGLEEPIEIYEAGIKGVAPLSRPPDSQKARRAIAPGDEETLGWRPGAGLNIPGRSGWRLERKLGAGGFGEAWLAVSESTRESRAFKFCFRADRLRTLKRELTLFRLLKETLGERDDIARLYDVRLDEAPFFLEMEYTPDGSLDLWAAKDDRLETMGIEDRTRFVAEVAEALAAAHSVGVLHKDVKPSNVLVRKDTGGRPHARLTDFGIGQLLDPGVLEAAHVSAAGFTETGLQSDVGSRSGTHLYMAPELFAGKPVSIASDVYALGVLLYQMIVGDLSRPLGHGWEREIADPLLVEDIAACVAGNPKERFASCDLVAEGLRSLKARRQLRAEEERRVSAEVRRAHFALRGVAEFETEANAYMQARVRLLALVLTILAGLLFVYDRVMEDDRADPLSQLAHSVAFATAICSYVLLRRRRFSAGALHRFDTILVLLSIGACLFVYAYPKNYRVGIYGIQPIMGLVILTRAIVVPSTGARTFWLSLPAAPGLLAIQICYGKAWVFSTRGAEEERIGVLVPPDQFISNLVVTDQVVIWMAIVLAVVASKVNFTLRREASEAKRLGQYVLEDRIGTGGMGEVYVAKHALLLRPTAVKILRPEVTGPESLERFKKEVQLTSRLTHPNTISIYDYGHTAGGLFYYAMELLDGADLERIVKRCGPMPAGRVIRVLTQACAALAEAHTKGLVHRDVKPANIILCEQGGELDVTKVMDFGLVKDLQHEGTAQTMVGVICGTPQTVAPEALRGDPVEAAADLYSLGVVGCYVLTAKNIFDVATTTAFIAHHLFRDPIRPSARNPDIPSDLEEILLACLDKDPAGRPAGAKALADALQGCADAGRWSQEDAASWWAAHGKELRSEGEGEGDQEDV